VRLIFACQECTIHYLPPEGLTYPDDSRPSSLWCSACQQAKATAGIVEDPVQAAVALFAAMRAMTAALAVRSRGTDGEPRPDRRPSRPARTGRGQKRPASARSKLR
jgi:hypothetical protein